MHARAISIDTNEMLNYLILNPNFLYAVSLIVTVKKCDDVKPMITPVKLGIRSNADMSRFFGTTFREFPFHTMRFLTVTI